MDWLWSALKHIVLSDNVLLTLLVVPVVFVAEYLRPARKAPVSAYRFDIAYWATNVFVLGVTTPVVAIAVAYAIQALGFGLIDLTSLGFSSFGGAVLALLVSTLITDFFYYWFHRTMHASKVLWQMHLLHHSDEHMNAMTANRGHFLEAALSPLFITVPLAILFKLPPVAIGVLSLVPYAYLFFVHANVRAGFGPLWWLVISPDYHRIHHSVEPEHRDKNFANWFPVWDIVFGTIWRPQPGERPATGVEGVRVKTLTARKRGARESRT